MLKSLNFFFFFFLHKTNVGVCVRVGCVGVALFLILWVSEERGRTQFPILSDQTRPDQTRPTFQRDPKRSPSNFFSGAQQKMRGHRPTSDQQRSIIIIRSEIIVVGTPPFFLISKQNKGVRLQWHAKVRGQRLEGVGGVLLWLALY